jgi:AmmeMemoRadiSam system protein B
MMASAERTAVRPSALAGTWYPAGEIALRGAVEGYLAQAQPVDLPGRVLALVSPHAGYAYSGPTAAFAYAQVRNVAYRRVVLLGPLHRPIWGSRIGAFMVPEEGAYRTALGKVPLDGAFISALGRQVRLTPVHGDDEHALEIELPFLQVALGSFSLVPIMFGDQISAPGTLPRVEGFASALASLCDESTLLVVSTDLTHREDYAEVVRTDRRLIALLSAFDVDGITADLQSGEIQACGATALVAALKTTQQLGARGARALAYATSGDIAVAKRPGAYTVGYLAAAIYR